MTRNIVIVGCPSFASEVAKSMLELNPDIKVTVIERLTTPFDPEPIRIRNYRDTDNIFPPLSPSIYDTEPNKFIGKPKNNFKKR